MIHHPLQAMLLLLQATGDVAAKTAHTAQHHGFWGGIGHWFKHASDVLVGRFGIWGLALIAFLDSALIPITPYAPLTAYISRDPARYILYALVTAVAASLGTVVPYFLGRVGGELFLLKKIERGRYERLRDRFERQEFVAIMIPAMCPPPTPLKLFELAAGVFEMRLPVFLLAMFLGKAVQMIAIAAFIRYLGPGVVGEFLSVFHRHARLLLTGMGLLLLAITIWIARRLFDRRSGTVLPIEETGNTSAGQKPAIVEE